jgi:glucosamine--fructose-6-phosphate aminotransferase (isomerizing)
LRESLTIQANLAPALVGQAWPALLDQARHHLAGWQETVSTLLVCGCGDSHFAAQGTEFGLRLWTGRRVRAASSMQAGRYLLEGADAGWLVIGISSSGEVARTVEALEQARRAGARTLALTCSPDSTLTHVADNAIVAELPEHPFGPGLVSYLATMLGVLAVGASLAQGESRRRLPDLVEALPERMAESAVAQAARGQAFADAVADAAYGVFLGSGPAFGAAGFAAAKVLEACGLAYHAQDVEEWAHLEYFQEPAETPSWILTSDGREATRVGELEHAARAVGRRLEVTRWQGNPDWSADEREALSPFGLWPAPVAFAQRLMERLKREPFRAFGGGRSRTEGGGASRIRSSQRLAPDLRDAAGSARRAEPVSHWHAAGMRL